MANQIYLETAEKTLNTIEACCDVINETTDADIDNIRNGNALTLSFQNNTQIIINLQKPIEEIWVAAKAGGYHFKLNADGYWYEGKEGRELFGALSEFASQQSGINLVFKA